MQPRPLSLPDLTRFGGPRWEIETDIEGEGREHLAGWIRQAAERNNLAALRDAIRQLAAPETFFDRRHALLAKIELAQALARIRVRGAQYLPAEGDLGRAAPARSTLAMRAPNTGDMYQVRASLAIHPDFNLLLWDVTPETRGQAEAAAGLVNDPARVFYTESPYLTGYSMNETWATRDIANYLNEDLLGGDNLAGLPADKVRRLLGIIGPSMIEVLQLRDMSPRQRVRWLKGQLGRLKGQGDDRYFQASELLRETRMETLARGFAPYSREEGERFQEDLDRHHFQGGDRYVIVNFRATGHSDRPGANAPALDTGEVGVVQLIKAVKSELPGVTVVPMGEEPREMTGGPNLLNYWTWSSTRGSRARQTGLLRYLNDNYEVVGAIGMRSGVMDQIAILGIPIISIDISPHRGLSRGERPDLSTSKGWSRGIKLEDAYRERYGHVFLHDPRENEQTRPVEGWEGAFSESDLATLKDGIRFYFAGGATARAYRHGSHPLDPERLRTSFAQLVGQLLDPPAPVTAYDLVNHYHPYVSEMDMLLRSVPELGRIWGRMARAIRDLQRNVESGRAQKIKWMRDHQYRALLEDDQDNRWYQDQRSAIVEAFGMPPDQAVPAYRQLDHHYRQPVGVESLVAVYVEERLLPIVRRIIRQVEAILATLEE